VWWNRSWSVRHKGTADDAATRNTCDACCHNYLDSQHLCDACCHNYLDGVSCES
jgi:hypothetical protein